MVRVSGDGGNTRRLPSWILGGAEQVNKSGENGDENNCSLEEGLKDEVCHSKTEKQRVKTVASKDKPILKVESNVRSGREKKRRKRESNLEEEHGGDVRISENSLGKKKCNKTGREVRESVLRKTRKANSGDDNGCSSGESFEIQSPDDHGAEDLTVEDLLSIAREYVKENEDSGLRLLTKRVGESPTTTASMVDDLADSLVRANKNPESSVQGRNISSDASTTTAPNLVNSSRTSDATQDMLDLFLGPLLKKPVQGKPTDIITKNVELGHESKRPREDEIGEGKVKHKKKSSLKDKVSLLLD